MVICHIRYQVSLSIWVAIRFKMCLKSFITGSNWLYSDTFAKMFPFPEDLYKELKKIQVSDFQTLMMKLKKEF